jgi:hypothetical protein
VSPTVAFYLAPFPFLIGILGFSWLIISGLRSGKTRIGGRFSPSRVVKREKDPNLYWQNIGVASVLLLACIVMTGLTYLKESREDSDARPVTQGCRINPSEGHPLASNAEGVCRRRL